MEKWKTPEAAFPTFPQGCYQRQKGTTSEGDRKGGGLTTASITPTR